jgi:hypothetical protein
VPQPPAAVPPSVEVSSSSGGGGGGGGGAASSAALGAAPPAPVTLPVRPSFAKPAGPKPVKPPGALHAQPPPLGRAAVEALQLLSDAAAAPPSSCIPYGKLLQLRAAVVQAIAAHPRAGDEVAVLCASLRTPADCLELALTEEEAERLLEAGRGEWERLPRWEQTARRRKAHLYLPLPLRAPQ